MARVAGVTEIAGTKPNVAGIKKVPRGYLTSQEFRQEGLSIINELCDKYGII